MTPEDLAVEGRKGVARIEAFSDGVIAIIITIMVLELKVPADANVSALFELWPVLFGYVVSYFYIAVYWVNHHRLFSHARVVTNGLLWSNMLFLFSLSLLPFATAYLGEHLGTQQAALIYLGNLTLPAIPFVWLQRVIAKTGDQSATARYYYRASSRKGLTALVIFLASFVLGCFAPYTGVTIGALVAVLGVLPWGPLDRLFGGGQLIDQD